MRRLATLLAAAALAACGPGGGSGEDGGDDGGDADAPPVDADFADADADGDGGRDADADGEVEDRCSPVGLAASTSRDRIRETIAELTELPERTTHAAQEQAADLLAARLTEAGLPWSEHGYGWAGRSWRNLVVELPGATLPEEIVAVGAHYDSISSVPSQAPGADDNASGVAAVVEVARALAGCSLPRTVRFLLFSNEEVGTVGSAAYAAEATRRGDEIVAYLNLDMVAYGDPGQDLTVATVPGDRWLAETVATTGSAHAGRRVVAIVDDHCG